MLIPQFSIRWLLILTAACAGVFSIFGWAMRGSQWATGVSLAMVALVAVLLVHAAVFGVVWVFSVVTFRSRVRPVRTGRSPFAQVATAPSSPTQAKPADDQDAPATPVTPE